MKRKNNTYLYDDGEELLWSQLPNLHHLLHYLQRKIPNMNNKTKTTKVMEIRRKQEEWRKRHHQVGTPRQGGDTWSGCSNGHTPLNAALQGNSGVEERWRRRQHMWTSFSKEISPAKGLISPWRGRELENLETQKPLAWDEWSWAANEIIKTLHQDTHNSRWVVGSLVILIYDFNIKYIMKCARL